MIRRPQCCSLLKRIGKYAVCTLDAGHASAHWDADLRVSWNDKQAVELAPRLGER